jgi:ribonuclease HI
MNKPSYCELLNRRITKRNMVYAQQAVADPSDEVPAVGKIWKSTGHKDLLRSARFFLWMSLHGGYEVGGHWEKIPGHEEKATCNMCGITESMEHILTKCDSPGQKEIWELASELWKLRGRSTPNHVRPDYGMRGNQTPGCRYDAPLQDTRVEISTPNLENTL